MTKTQLSIEFEEIKNFINFVEKTKRLDNIEHINRYRAKRTPDCIHVLEDFLSTATQDYEKKAAHLKRLDKTYKPYREHALNCLRCQASLDSIFTFTGYENRGLFSPTIQKILEKEFNLNSERTVYLCKLPAPGLNYSELTYITELPLNKAVERFNKKIKIPLDLPEFKETYKRKISSNGKGIAYTQLYLYPEDQRHKTKISIRSKTR